MSKFFVELMLAITEYNYFKPAAGVPAERSVHNPSFEYERNKKNYKYHRNRRNCPMCLHTLTFGLF